ncbi:subtilisin-like protein, partial [Colletotrichum somersetense]
GYFNAEGRGYPDVSAMSLNYLVDLYGDYRAVKGTSTAMPLIASMFARINDERLHTGKRTNGFVNPVLYGHRDQFARDVEAGVDEGCGVDEAIPAARAWDAVTGLGSLDYAKLKDLYLPLP